jgi:uncharacterized membrane protein YhdT
MKLLQRFVNSTRVKALLDGFQKGSEAIAALKAGQNPSEKLQTKSSTAKAVFARIGKAMRRTKTSDVALPAEKVVDLATERIRMQTLLAIVAFYVLAVLLGLCVGYFSEHVLACVIFALSFAALCHLTVKLVGDFLIRQLTEFVAKALTIALRAAGRGVLQGLKK